MDSEVRAYREHWVDCLAAFGAWVEIEELPEHVEHRTRNDPAGVGERPVRVRVVNRQFVTGAVLNELDGQRGRIVAAFMHEERLGLEEVA